MRKFEEYTISINIIKGVGDFLIVEGKNLTKSIITEKLKIKNPEFITIPFSDVGKG